MKYVYIFEVYNFLTKNYEVEYITHNEKSADFYFKSFIALHQYELIRVRTDYTNYRYKEENNG